MQCYAVKCSEVITVQCSNKEYSTIQGSTVQCSEVQLDRGSGPVVAVLFLK